MLRLSNVSRKVLAACVVASALLPAACSSSKTEEGKSSTSSGGPGGSAIHHVLSTGQSNSVGFNAKPPVSLEQPFANLMFDVGVMTATACDGKGCKTYATPTAFVPLVEGDRYDSDPVETMSSGLANHVTELEGGAGKHDLLVSVHGKSGYVYECLRKGSCTDVLSKGYLDPFAEGMRQVKDAKQIAEAAGREYVVSGVTVVHGESDHYATTLPLDGTDGTPGAIKTYADALVEWQRDYEKEIKTITGQADAVPLFYSQIANWNDVPASDIPVQQVDAMARAPGKLVLVAPTYMLDYTADCIHFTSAANRKLGAYFAEAYAKVVIEGKTWEPVHPTDVKLAGDTITVKYAVPNPPLTVDTETVTDPGSYGFTFEDDAAETPYIASVDLTGPDTLTVKLSAAPTGQNKRLRYGQNGVPKTCPGPKQGPRGNVRDSSEAATGDGEPLWNWSVIFDAKL